ncbi:retrotransposon protein, putative, ty1-copia subclass [Tanacetum coccineum]
MEQMTSICDMVGQIMQKKEEEKRIAEDQAARDRYWKIPICYDDDEDYTIAITPVLSTEEPVDSLIMEDEHLDAIPATESDEVIKSSVENLVQIPSESKGISDGGCDVPLCDNPTPLEAFKEHSETIIDSNNDSISSDDDYPYGEDIDYVDASPPDAEIVSLEVVESVIPEVGGVDIDILLTIKDDILRERFLNVNLLISNIEALKDNPVPSFDFVIKSPSTFPNSFLEETNTFDNSLTESETFRFNLEEISSGSTTTRSDYSLLDYEAFYINDDHIEEKSSGSTTTHSVFSLSKYDSFIFDLSINPFPPADRSDFEGAPMNSLKSYLHRRYSDFEDSRAHEDLEIIQEEDTHPSIDTSLNHEEDDLEIDEPQSDIIPIRRSTRTRHAPDRMCLYIDAEEHELGDLGEPANYKAALLDPESDKWLNAMNVEMQSMKDNEVWDLVDLPPNGKTVGSKWLFKKKTDMDGAVHTYKAHLVVKGYTQTPWIDYEKTFSPIADIRAIRILLAIVAFYDYEIWKIDVKTAFLNGYLSEEVYMEQPEGFVNPKYPNRVCKLKRSIYGLKQASRQRNK